MKQSDKKKKSSLGGKNAPAQGFFVVHGEKLALGVVGLLVVLCVYGAIQRTPYTRSPDDLRNIVSQKSTTVTSNHPDAFADLQAKQVIPFGKFVRPQDEVGKPSEEPTAWGSPDPYLRGSQKRGEPQYLRMDKLSVFVQIAPLALKPDKADEKKAAEDAPAKAKPPAAKGKAPAVGADKKKGAPKAAKKPQGKKGGFNFQLDDGFGGAPKAAGGGGRAASNMKAQAFPVAVITGRVPREKQADLYRKAFEFARDYSPAADSPVYAAFVLQRADVTEGDVADENDPKWQDVLPVLDDDGNQIGLVIHNLKLLERCAGTMPEIVDESLGAHILPMKLVREGDEVKRWEGLTASLPRLLGEEWSDKVAGGFPVIKPPETKTGMPGGAGGGGNMPGGAGGMPGGGGGMPGGGGGMPGGGGGMPGGGGGMPGGGGGMPGGGGGMPGGAGGMPGGGGGMPGGGGGGMQKGGGKKGGGGVVRGQIRGGGMPGGGGGMPGGGGGMPGGGGGMPGGGGGMPGGGGGMPGGGGGMPGGAGGMPGGAGGMPGGASGGNQDPFQVGGKRQGGQQNVGGQRVQANQMADVLFRFFDFSIEEGRRYRYRVKLVLANPNKDKPPSVLKDAKTAEGEYRLTDWSDKSDSVSITGGAEVLAGSVRGDDFAELIVRQRDWDMGAMVAAPFGRIQPGQLLNLKGDALYKDLVTEESKKLERCEFNSGELVLDMTSGSDEILVLDADGNLTVRGPQGSGSAVNFRSELKRLEGLVQPVGTAARASGGGGNPFGDMGLPSGGGAGKSKSKKSGSY
jgi:hypothetical protein